MAKVMASSYRYTQKDKEGDGYTRTVLSPGDPVNDLPKEVRDDLEKRGLIVDDNEMLASGARLPRGEKAEDHVTVADLNKSESNKASNR